MCLTKPSIKTLGVCVLLAGLVSGCRTVGPDYQAPAPEMPDAWNEAVRAEFATGAPPLSAWWKVFGDASLNELIDQATEGNLDLKSAAARVEEARAQLGFARGERLPTAEAIGDAQTTQASEETVPAGLDREGSLYQAGAVVNWELDVWGRIARSIESAEAGYESTVETWRDVLVLLHADVASTYFELRSVQERIGFAKANRKAQQDTLELVQNRFKAELVPELDVKQAELNLATTSATIPALRIARFRTLNRLGILTGKSPNTLHALLGAPAAMPPPPKDIAVGQPVNLLRQRPDVRRAERLLASQHARIGLVTGDLYPRFALPGSFVFEAPDVGDLISGDALAYGFGPSVRWSLFSGGRIRNAIRVEEARTKQALHDYESTVLRALEEVENAMVALKEERERNAALGDAVAAAEASTQLVDTLYRAGLTNFQNVLDMQRTLTAQQDTLAESNGNLGQNATQLYKALGGGWDPAVTPGTP